MDIYKFRNLLFSFLEDEQDPDVILASYEATTKMMAFESSELKVAYALIDTAHMLLFAARDVKGSEFFTQTLENRLEEAKRARVNSSIRLRTEDINKAET